MPILSKAASPVEVQALDFDAQVGAAQGKQMSAVMMVCQTLPLHIISEANSRQHWREVAYRKKLHRELSRTLMQRHERPIHGGQITITLTRIAPRTLDDDNLASGFKASRDGVADWLGIDDGDKRLTWRYAQRKGAVGWYAAECMVEWSI